MSLPVRFSAEASAELDRAPSWYDEQRAGLGDAFIEAVDAAVRLIDDWPGSGVLAVAHDRRRPGYWTPRVRR